MDVDLRMVSKKRSGWLLKFGTRRNCILKLQCITGKVHGIPVKKLKCVVFQNTNRYCCPVSPNQLIMYKSRKLTKKVMHVLQTLKEHRNYAVSLKNWHQRICPDNLPVHVKYDEEL